MSCHVLRMDAGTEESTKRALSQKYYVIRTIHVDGLYRFDLDDEASTPASHEAKLEEHKD